MYKSLTFFFLLLFLVIGSSYLCAKTQVVIRQESGIEHVLKGRDKKFIIKADIDLNGRTVKVGKDCSFDFKGGSFSNGTIIGDKTIVCSTQKNVFHNCLIIGDWLVDVAYSTMFDDELNALILLKNMSCLSSVLRLSANRVYLIDSGGESIDVKIIESIGNEKPLIVFHTTVPNVSGIQLYGDIVTLRNLSIKDDYNPNNDAIYGQNDVTKGNTISVFSRRKVVNKLLIENCDFSGGTSSSYIASSQIRDCEINNCRFSGYIADHAVYCSKKTVSFLVNQCELRNIIETRSVFKVRSSIELKKFSLCNINAHNLNGYMAQVSLLETPLCELMFNNIKLTKDPNNDSVFYGFCLNDETRNNHMIGYNAKDITINNCHFTYGYNGNALLYEGAGTRARVATVKYVKSLAVSSNFSGCVSDQVIVSQCTFSDCCNINKKGMALMTRSLSIDNTTISDNKTGIHNCLFLINYSKQLLESIRMNKVSVGANVNRLFDITKGKGLSIIMRDCEVSSIEKELLRSPSSCFVSFNKDKCIVNNKIDK